MRNVDNEGHQSYRTSHNDDNENDFMILGISKVKVEREINVKNTDIISNVLLVVTGKKKIL